MRPEELLQELLEKVDVFAVVANRPTRSRWGCSLGATLRIDRQTYRHDMTSCDMT